MNKVIPLFSSGLALLGTYGFGGPGIEKLEEGFGSVPPTNLSPLFIVVSFIVPAIFIWWLYHIKDSRKNAAKLLENITGSNKIYWGYFILAIVISMILSVLLAIPTSEGEILYICLASMICSFLLTSFCFLAFTPIGMKTSTILQRYPTFLGKK